MVISGDSQPRECLETHQLEKAIVDPEDAARDDALVDNTAQGIFNYLDDVENKREVYQRRWIWELLQNALDSTEEGKTVEVTITSNGSELTFEHNGRSFKQNEVAHLNYHGSTKLESSIGKFGTGFLVTHLLTSKVTVRGKRMDGKSFDFVLDRSGKSAQEIKEQADLNWRNYKSSLKSPRDAFPFSAQYTYLYEDRVAPTVNEGLLALTEIAPYVIAFSRKFGKITINDGSTKRTFQLSSGPETPPTKPRLVSEQVGGEDPTTHEIQVVADSDIEVALKLTRQE